MKSPWQIRKKWIWLSLNFLAAAWSLGGAVPVVEEPRLLTLKPSDLYIGAEVEAERESRTSANSSLAATVDRLYAAPIMGLGLKGSVYHPNLVQFDLHGEGGYGWQQINASSGTGFAQNRDESTWLQRYNVSTVFLASKPYAATFLANKVHTFRDVDFFNHVTVDSQSYGGQFGYSAGPVPVSVSVRHTEEDQSDLLLHSIYDQDIIEVRARNERNSAKDATDFFYSFGQYDRQTSSLFRDHGTYHYGSLYDIEKFGQGDHMVLSSALTLNQVDSPTLPSKNLSATENFLVDHTQTLQSLYDYNFNAFSSGPVDSFSHYGRAALRHQLFDSLTSIVDVHGDTIDTESSTGSQTLWRYGVGLSETYTKRLSSWGRLTIGNNVRLDQEQRENSGSLLDVVGERQTLNDAATTFLRQPRVISVTRVTDPNGITNYVRGVDYELIRHGELTEIRRLLTSTELLNGMTVLVDYVASAQPSGSFSTLADQFQIRLDLFKGLLGIYSRLNWIENTHSARFVLEDGFNTQSGVEASWRWLRAGTEYETRDSNLLTYNAINVYESAAFVPSDGATWSLDFRQRWATFPTEHRSLTDYNFVTRYHQRITSYLYYLIEGGVRWEQGQGLDQRQATARTELNFALGKLRVHLGYQFNNDDIRGELREKHFVYLRARRNF